MTDHSSDWRNYPLLRLIARAVALIWRWNNDHEGQRPLLGRLTAHIAVILTLGFLTLLGALKIDTLASVAEMADQALLVSLAENVDAASGSPSNTERPYYRIASQARIVRQANFHTAIPDRPRLQIITYMVEPGDTTQMIAEKFGLQPTTIMWSNPEMERRPDLLQVGQVLTILPIDGVYHTVEISDTLESIAEAYQVQPDAILSCPFNTIPEQQPLAVGHKLIVPGGTKPYEAQSVTAYDGPVPADVSASGIFNWPASGVLTQGYWYGHRAVDIGSYVGTAILAADGGFVSFAGWTDIGYGYLIVIDHGNRYHTYYAHLSDLFVWEGQLVSVGQTIGAMGSTGNSTGPHLHFEIRYDNYPTNPLIYLP
ncbi:MAG: peptidoglycan DD-metalloendopeptidase family protein [Anaerolineae bacterium]|nr:peptidoglycan DD-metalloendopeptidase family protein [Anaerolineae bacterium]